MRIRVQETQQVQVILEARSNSKVVGGCERCSTRPDDVCNQSRQRQRLVRAGAAVAPGYILPGCGPQPPQEGKRVSALLTLPLPRRLYAACCKGRACSIDCQGCISPDMGKRGPSTCIQGVQYVS